MSTPDSLFSRLAGPAFSSLPTAVQRLHCAADGAVFGGHASVRRGRGLGYAAGVLTSLPPTLADAPLRVTICRDAVNETWKRDFDGHRMLSRLTGRDGFLSERLGLVRFSFHLTADNDAIVWSVAHVSLLGIPLPASWFGGVSAREYARDNHYCFAVHASLPLLGMVIEYDGELQVDDRV